MLQYLHEVLHHGAELVPVLDTGWPALVQPVLPAAGRDVPDVPPLPGSTRDLHSPHTGEVEIWAFCAFLATLLEVVRPPPINCYKICTIFTLISGHSHAPAVEPRLHWY